MEPESSAGLVVRITNVESRQSEAEQSRGRIWDRLSDIERAQAVDGEKLQHQREDIIEIRDTVRWLTRGAWAVAATFLMLAVTVAVAVLA